jgi:hypothetical protein
MLDRIPLGTGGSEIDLPLSLFRQAISGFSYGSAVVLVLSEVPL